MPSASDPLNWPGYEQARARARAVTGAEESVTYGQALIGDIDVMLIEFDFRFLGGSVGTATGGRLVHALSTARAHAIPVVSLLATGGSRMQEGMFALLQLQRVARECHLNQESGIPHVTVLRNPTTGGVWASLGASADVILATGGAQVAFGGRRVRSAEDADHPAFTATGQFAAGQVDEVVTPESLPDALSTWLELLTGGAPEPADVPKALGNADLPANGWEAVSRARDPRRPRAAAYLDAYFDTYRLISGDRAGGVDPGVLCGIGWRGGRSIAFAAQAGTATRAAGYRTVSRLITMADRLGIPVLTLIDTPGAANNPTEEAAGLAAAISSVFTAIAATQIPVTTLVIGEGGSGGALAMAGAGRTWITPDAYFSVIAPELAAAILKRDQNEATDLADQLHLRPQDLLNLGIVDGIA
ncbi:carboxyl transferase domain-containing protein [Kibdelosporangium phytohabitans]|uniref:carboxyl transferase domain-containing protein n=1 Tax=Kibdelosporangium phytohabitans TaxID=860235 RepID=UPI0009FAC7F6|nr:carboxyl transferase domain-containing protein [Kibdelosporangium phytohabitans]MBE1467246.1 acetyl-CoA carboxylase carboxyl transferase subunit beta [Kibdelosporangium phytohabitans]